MKKIYNLKKVLLVVAALFTSNMMFAQQTETFEQSSGATKDAAITGTSYTIAGTYNAGGGSTQAGTMASKGFKMRTGSDGNRCVFSVNKPYVITKLELEGICNYTAKDTELPCIVVTKVEVDGVEIATWTGGNFPQKGSGATDSLSITNINAKESIAIYFDNSNASGNQVNTTYIVTYDEPDVAEPTITLSPDTVNLIPGVQYALDVKIVPTTFADATFWYINDLEQGYSDWEEGKDVSDGIISVTQEGVVTALAPGTSELKLTWLEQPELNQDTTIVIVNDFKIAEHKVIKAYDFTAMGDVELAIAGESFQIWNDGNKQCNGVQFCTNEGLEELAFQAVINSSSTKGYKIVDGEGLYLTGAGRCGAVGGLKTGQYVEFVYTGSLFATKDYTMDLKLGPDAGTAKKVINEEVGHKIYQVQEKNDETENLMIGFEISTGKYIKSITIYGEEADPTAIQTVEPKQAEKDGAVYNLMGIKVAGNAKGMFIKNGQKYIVK